MCHVHYTMVQLRISQLEPEVTAGPLSGICVYCMCVCVCVYVRACPHGVLYHLVQIQGGDKEVAFSLSPLRKPSSYVLMGEGLLLP